MTPRRARLADRAALAGLWRELLDHHAASLRIAASEVPSALLDTLLREGDGAAWILEREERAVGFCAAHFEAAPRALSEPGRARISELYVKPDARRRGAGSALVAAAFEWARSRGAARVEVRVAARNAEGQAFWRALGFGDFVDVLDRRL